MFMFIGQAEFCLNCARLIYERETIFYQYIIKVGGCKLNIFYIGQCQYYDV